LNTNIPLNVCIVDDEANIRQNLKHQLKLIDLPINILGEADNVAKGLALLHEHEPDIVFLDVEMPDGKGFDILRQMPDLQAKVIFITAHNHYAVEAFKFSALDYLLKPLDSEELEKALRKAFQSIEKESYQLKINAFLNNMEDVSTKYKKIVLKNSDSIFAVNISEIIRLEASNNYTTFYTETNPPIIVSKTLKDYEDLLSQYGFYRIHQSHLINLNFFSRYDKKDGGMVIMKDKTILPISLKKKDQLFTYLASL
jgi:two-component system, LytTR family, response regulator